MSAFTLTIRLGNDAMQTGHDVAEVLRKVAERLETETGTEPLEDCHAVSLLDVNGNRVGQWKVREDE